MPTFAPLLFRLEDNGTREAEHFVSGLLLLLGVLNKQTNWIFLMEKERKKRMFYDATYQF